jgi:uncharacterized protein (DUF305 family)
MAAMLVAVAAGASCRSAGQTTPIVQPGAPGQSTRVIPAEKASDLSHVGHTAADVRFMQGMIGHHAQAVEMCALLTDRTRRDDMRLLARRIAISQADEIRMMQEWLKGRGAAVPTEHAHHANGAALMPGMLTPDEMRRLADSTGDEFDRLFLEYMIKHHGGALIMVNDLFSQPGAGQESEIFAFAADVDADQRMEIERMDAMLKELQK